MKKPLGLIDGRIRQLQAMGLCDVSLLLASLLDNYLTDGQEILFDQNGIQLGFSSGMMPQECKQEFNNGLSGIDERFLFGLEGEMLI